MIKTHRSRLWKRPHIVVRIVQNLFLLDPTVLIGNPEIYYVEDKGNLISFLALKKHGKVYELKSVYTLPPYRKKRHMHRLIRHALKGHKQIYLLCKPRLTTFYTSLGFKPTLHAPFWMQFQKQIVQVATLGNLTLVLMKKE